MRTFLVEDPRYRAWLRDHPDGYVAMYRVSDGRLVVHRPWCERADPLHISQGGMAAVRVCAETVGELTRWTDEELRVDLAECAACMPVPIRIRRGVA